MTEAHDDLGSAVRIARPAQRVVSLVPSLTEALASVHPERVVGATQWCTHPQDLQAMRVRGTKNPDVGAIVRLSPDLVVANKEENRQLDVARLRRAHVPVWVTDIRTVPQAISSMQRLFDVALQWPRPTWIAEAESRWCTDLPPATRTVAIAIWRDPWMVIGSDTFTGDLVRRLGWDNRYALSPDRYPMVDLAELDNPDLDVVLLPDEPYPFRAQDGPEAFAHVRTQLVSGRVLTWYGPSLLEAGKVTIA